MHEKYEIVWLDVDYDVIIKRKRLEGKERPIVFPKHITSFKELYDERKNYTKHIIHRIRVTEDEVHLNVEKNIECVGE